MEQNQRGRAFRTLVAIGSAAQIGDALKLLRLEFETVATAAASARTPEFRAELDRRRAAFDEAIELVALRAARAPEGPLPDDPPA